MLLLALLSGLLVFGHALAMGEDELSFMRTEPQILNEGQVGEMQNLLTEQGYEVDNIRNQTDSVHGVLTDRTTAAIRQFQDTEGLTITGYPNEETLRALAPSSDKQEFFGLSPEFGERQ
jgi:peptidoglycan hydrolase-like protein with peptidoglycan-binding domain